MENDLQTAVESAYKLTSKVKFENGFFRKDIGARALKAKEYIDG